MFHYANLTDPTPAEIQRIITLYRHAGWWSEEIDDPGLVNRIVAGSHCFIAATLSGRIIGMGRAISDGASDAYIQDVTVDSAFRGKGVAAQIVQLLIERLKADGISWIGLIAEQNSHGFYEKLGFTEMRDAKPLLMILS